MRSKSNIPPASSRASGLLSKPCLVLFCVLFPLYTPTLAQIVPPPQTVPLPGDQNLIQERQQKLLEDQQRRLEELKRLPSEPAAPTPAPPSEPGGCVNITRIEIEGADRLSEARQRKLVSPFEGHCLDSGKLNELLSVLTQAYLDRGLITSRAYLPPQDLSEGVLKIRVIEGRLEGFERRGTPSPREIRMSFPGRIGEVLNLRELEQMLDQLGRLPSRASTLDLIPGAEPGTSRIDVKTEPQKPWRAGLRFDNTGYKSTGERQASVFLTWDSPLGLADQLSLNAGRDTDHRHARHANNQALSYSVPWGWYSFNYSY
ncbi:MAG: ShlB/FhaC/HecB family hemolysin secretion/activation protein, partial [Betaproteobacteria bacterium]|nr:ShlB/FhaC/HecB family hemolysin secretion/activation protein [Betaproteobacteria bacterium]